MKESEGQVFDSLCNKNHCIAFLLKTGFCYAKDSAKFGDSIRFLNKKIGDSIRICENKFGDSNKKTNFSLL